MPTGSEFSRVDLGGNPTKETNYGQVNPGSQSYSGTDMVPTPTPSMQFSSNRTGDPKELLEQTRAGVEAHASLLDAYGLGAPMADLGKHPWLRDSLTVTTQMEPGDAAPNGKRGYPFDEDKGD